MIQDLIFTAGGVIFIVALLPSVFSEHKPPLSTCLITGSVLAVFAATYLTLDLTFGAVTTAISAAVWFTLAVQQYIIQREARRQHDQVKRDFEEAYRTNQGRMMVLGD